jgi:photosystem II stability/assembly factor-like uncharacterized protein
VPFLCQNITNKSPVISHSNEQGYVRDEKEFFPSTNDPTVNDIAIYSEPVEGTWIFAGCSGTSDKGIWLSTNGGNSWNQKLSDVDIYSVDFASATIAYAGSGNGIYKGIRESGIWTWSKLDNSPSYQINSLKAINEDIVYAATTYGMYKTPDGGDTWYEINEGIYTNIMFSLIIHPQNSQTLFAGGEFSVYKTTDGGVEWSEITKGFKLLNLKVNNILTISKDKDLK